MRRNVKHATDTHRLKVRWALVIYDVVLQCIIAFLVLYMYKGHPVIPKKIVLFETGLAIMCTITARFGTDIYRQIWRYGGIQCYIRLMISDAIAFWLYFPIQTLVLRQSTIGFGRCLSFASMNLLASLAIRMVYRYAYKCGSVGGFRGKLLRALLRVFSGGEVVTQLEQAHITTKIAIVGAGKTGIGLAEELTANQNSGYTVRCYVDINKDKVGRQIHGVPVVAEEETTLDTLAKFYDVQEIVFALPNLSMEERRRLYDKYSSTGLKLKTYDYPVMERAGGSGKLRMRDFEVEELLFRKPVTGSDENTVAYYRGKTVLITGGGGSIGSELTRQIAGMEPKRLVILDVYENGAYDVQQELRIAYGSKLDLRVEIVSVCDEKGLEQVFIRHRPDVVIHAAAHKHVPLMENCAVEAVKNNVFGTLNVVCLSEKYHAKRFMMVSTDKAVNPTNVMGATKRMCEMLVQCHSRSGSGTLFSATRFGNVLGSAGSVIPLFRRQIAAGGPVTVTDKRIIRYFMTIPEASRLVLQSGRMAKNGELFVLDMGKPVKILDLAENMIRLSGYEPYRDVQIVETGLRPGEKLYEELLIRTEELDKTENDLIFVERDEAITPEELEEKLRVLRAAVATEDGEEVKRALHAVVPSFRTPEEVNAKAEQAREMQQ